jgi:hypothetical protein
LLFCKSDQDLSSDVEDGVEDADSDPAVAVSFFAVVSLFTAASLAGAFRPP